MNEKNRARNEAMAAMRPDHTLEEIGNAFGVTRQRVKQIFDVMGVAGQRLFVNCVTCGVQYEWGSAREHRKVHSRRMIRTPEIEMKWEAMVADYLDGMRMEEISRKYRTETGKPVTFTYIYRVLGFMGVEPNRGKGHYTRTPETRRRMSAAQSRRRNGERTVPRTWRANE
jgi:hypothetical protein